MATHSTNTDSFGHQETKVSIPMSSKDHKACANLLQQLRHAKIIDSHAYDETTSTAHLSHSSNVAKEEQPRDLNLERVLAVPMSGDDYEICTIGTGLLRQIAFSELIHAFSYEEETAAATLYYRTRVEEKPVRGIGEEAQVEQLEGVQ